MLTICHIWHWWIGLDSGDKPTWMAAFFAAGAFAFTGRTLWASESDRRARQRHEESEQARAVSIVLNRTGGAGILGDHVDFHLVVTVRNDSTDAIHDVRAIFDVQPKSAVISDGVLDDGCRLIGHGEHASFQILTSVKWDPARGGAAETTAVGMVEFTDIEGRRWSRDHEYRLKRLK
jgi:hypothetical protein